MNRRWKIVATLSVLALGFLGLSTQISGADTPSEASGAQRDRARSARTVAARSSLEETQGTQAAQNETQARPSEQRTPPDREYGQGQFAGLGVSENQQAQIEAIQADEREQIAEMRATIHDTTRRARWNAIRREAEALIIDVLTPEQRRAREVTQARRRVASVNQRVRQMSERVRLSTGQASQIRRIIEQWDIDKDNANRNDDNQQAALVRVREAAEAAMLNALTPDQQVQLQRMWDER